MSCLYFNIDIESNFMCLSLFQYRNYKEFYVLPVFQYRH